MYNDQQDNNDKSYLLEIAPCILELFIALFKVI